MNGAIASARAELLRIRKWPAVWITVGVWLTVVTIFGYLFNYVAYKTGGESFTAEGESTSADLLAQVLPGNLPELVVQLTPMFGGALMLVFGALVAGGGYGWGTWKTIVTQGPSRTSTMAGSLLAVTVVVATVTAATLVLCTGYSSAIAVAESQALGWSSVGSVAESVGVAFLVLQMWAMLGFLLATLARGPSLAIGLGLVWALVVESLLRPVGSLIGFVDILSQGFPGTVAGSVVGALIGVVPGGNGAPGVVDSVAGPQATVTVLAYLVGVPLLAIALVRRRDVV